MFHITRPILKILKLFQVVIIVHGDILRLMALMLGANRLLAMAKDSGGLRFNVMGKMFF
jgi:hypothetical protein